MERIRQLSSSLGRAPALAYLLGYPLLILLFSFIFWALSASDFHQFTTDSGRRPAETTDSIRQDLRTEIKQTYRMNGVTNQVVNGWHMVPDELDLAYLHTSFPLGFDFELVIPLKTKTGIRPYEEAFVEATIMVYTNGRYILNDVVYLPFGIHNFSSSPLEGLPTALPPPATQISPRLDQFPGQIPPPAIASPTGPQFVLPLSLKLYNKIVAYGESSQGLPATDPMGYARALNFSAGVATFRAAGDLLPASALAGLLVFAETALALVLIGLFVNSLAYSVGEPLRGPQKAEPDTTRLAANPREKRTTEGPANEPLPAAQKKRVKWIKPWVIVVAALLALVLCIVVLAGIALVRMIHYYPLSRSSPPTVVILPTFTFTGTPTPVVSTPAPLPTLGVNPLTHMKTELPAIGSNLLKNSGFEDALSDWKYSDNVAGVQVFEINGINGKAFCSRWDSASKDRLQQPALVFAQKVPIDPTGSYFFSGWMELNKVVHVYALAEWYNGSRDVGWSAATPFIGKLPEGETTDGWVFVHGTIQRVVLGADSGVFGIWQPPIYDSQATVDSTICVDDLIFGKIIK